MRNKLQSHKIAHLQAFRASGVRLSGQTKIGNFRRGARSKAESELT
jgi:hypothetical protein